MNLLLSSVNMIKSLPREAVVDGVVVNDDDKISSVNSLEPEGPVENDFVDDLEEKGGALYHYKSAKAIDELDAFCMCDDDDDAAADDDDAAELKIALPTGKLGVFFKGSTIARISRLGENCRCLCPCSSHSNANAPCMIGMVVDLIEMPDGRVYCGMTARECAHVLTETMDTEGRIMTLKKNSTASTLSRRNVTSVDAGGIFKVCLTMEECQ